MSNNVNAIILDLSRINKILKRSPTEREIFLSNFKKWADQRKDTLCELKKLKNELNDICFNAKVGKCLGKGAGVVGGLAAIVGIGLQFSRVPDIRSTGQKITSFGLKVGLLGGATSVTSTGMEYAVNKRILNELKSSLKKDQELTRQLVPYLENSDSADLNVLLRQVFGCDMYSDTLKDIFKVVRAVVSLYREGKYAYEEISEALSSSLEKYSDSFDLESIIMIFQGLGKKAQIVLKEFCENRKVRVAMLEIEKSIARSSIILDISEVTARLFFRMFGISNEGGYMSLVTRFASDAKVTNILSKTVSLAFDIVGFIALAKDIPDSESEYSEMVGKIQFYLAKELSEANRLVNQLNGNQF